MMCDSSQQAWLQLDRSKLPFLAQKNPQPAAMCHTTIAIAEAI
jgi:hypothetical protein